jgi:hypothetical protein
MVRKQQGMRRARHDSECSKAAKAKSKNNNKTIMLKEKNKNQQ